MGAFVFVAGNLRGDEMVRILERQLPRMLKMARGRARPFLAGITRTSLVVYPIRKRK